MAGKSRTKSGKLGCMPGRRRAKSESNDGATRVRHAKTLASKSLLCGDTQVKRNGLY